MLWIVLSIPIHGFGLTVCRVGMTFRGTKKKATEVDKLIGTNIRYYRCRHGLTQGELGALLGVRCQQAQKYEHGENKLSAGGLKILADYFKVPVDAFFVPPGDAVEAVFDKGTVQGSALFFTAYTDLSETHRALVLELMRGLAGDTPD